MDNLNTVAMISTAVDAACDVPEAERVVRVLLDWDLQREGNWLNGRPRAASAGARSQAHRKLYLARAEPEAPRDSAKAPRWEAPSKQTSPVMLVSRGDLWRQKAPSTRYIQING